MNSRPLGANGPLLSEIGFGAWAIGGPWKYGWGNVDDNESIAAIHRALDLGVTWIDTAAQYGHGHSEEVAGKAIRGRRDRVFIATKCGQVWDQQKNLRTDLSAKSIRQEIDQSLQRLRTDYVDLYQIHWPDGNTPIEESWGELARLKVEGKTRFIGVCNFGVDLLERCEKIAHVQSLQPIYNLLEREIEREILPYCTSHGIGIIAYSPMQSGLLTGAFEKSKLAQDDWRIVHSEKFREPKFSRGLRVVEELRPIAAKYNKTVGQVAIAWVLMNSSVTSAIAGARTVPQVEQNVGGTGWVIAADDMRRIESVLKTP